MASIILATVLITIVTVRMARAIFVMRAVTTSQTIQKMKITNEVVTASTNPSVALDRSPISREISTRILIVQNRADLRASQPAKGGLDGGVIS